MGNKKIKYLFELTTKKKKKSKKQNCDQLPSGASHHIILSEAPLISFYLTCLLLSIHNKYSCNMRFQIVQLPCKTTPIQMAKTLQGIFVWTFNRRQNDGQRILTKWPLHILLLCRQEHETYIMVFKIGPVDTVLPSHAFRCFIFNTEVLLYTVQNKHCITSILFT